MNTPKVSKGAMNRVSKMFELSKIYIFFQSERAKITEWRKHTQRHGVDWLGQSRVNRAMKNKRDIIGPETL